MTANRDAQSVEDRKARYSRELAAYTLRQWDLVRQAMESGPAGADKAMNSSQRDRSSSVPRDSDRSSRVSGVHVHDYAQSPHRQMSSGRTVTAGNV
ncbi:hypothetical protein K466DRAFT_543874 [Polyporus arcularius HHB13444]|uniref:Uncharacterized protein n=1 Tax=Polyporus arcularius HHB13444 TaxID=1314778 RepID=A0A5C3PKD4_9APHY|nr:hypothetical protein K466DRAFT_543874 [Polyporus arcularius HHB13444]